MSKVLIVGASGFLGTKLNSSLSKGHEVIGTYDRHEKSGLIHLNASDKDEVARVISEVRPDIVIHSAGSPDLDYCEQHPDETENVHHQSVKNLVEACRSIGARVIYISSTYVFGGDKAPYKETDPVSPINEYGKAKARAEQDVLGLPKSSVIRFDFLYGYNGPDLPNGLTEKILGGQRIEATDKQTRKPLLVDDVAKAIDRIIETNGSGVYHLAGPDNITKYELCMRLAKTLDTQGDIYPIESKVQVARRAIDTSLTTERLQELSIVCTPVDEALKLIGQQFRSDNKESGRKETDVQ